MSELQLLNEAGNYAANGRCRQQSQNKAIAVLSAYLVSPSIVIVASVIFDRFLASDFNAVARMFGVPHFFLLERVYGWTGRAVFYGSPILFLYNIAVYLLLARRLNQDKSWIETVMMVIVILASFLLFLAIVFLILDMRGGDIMPVPEP